MAGWLAAKIFDNVLRNRDDRFEKWRNYTQVVLDRLKDSDPSLVVDPFPTEETLVAYRVCVFLEPDDPRREQWPLHPLAKGLDGKLLAKMYSCKRITGGPAREETRLNKLVEAVKAELRRPGDAVYLLIPSK
ncbi:hypothetical protein HK405_001761 [Cladochytrium tenue]|nr:hypothetical protein HK405_001761 [Cladochytrium tenue]